MLQKVKNVILVAMTLTVGTTSLLGLAVATAVPAYADIASNLCQGVNTAANGTSSTDCTAGSNFNLSTIATSIVNIFSWIVGVVAVIMIIVGGFRYITSGGSSEKISSAKNTLIYAIIGLIIVALAQFIVHYVVNTAANGTLSNTTG
jgi:uncharacterized membrane protein